MALAAPSKPGGFSPGKENSRAPEKSIEAIPLDERCAQYVLSVIVLYLRQTMAFEPRLLSTTLLSLDTSFYDFESVDMPNLPPAAAFYMHDTETILSPKASATTIGSANTANTKATSASTPIPTTPHFTEFQKTHLSVVKNTRSMHKQIGKYAGLIIRHLSQSNWSVVFSRIRGRVENLSVTSEENPDTIDLQLMNHSAMDRSKLIQVLQGAHAMCPICDTLRELNAIPSTLVTTCQHETRNTSGACSPSARSHLELDRYTPRRIQ